EGQVGILNLNDPTNPLSVLGLMTSSNELDALSGFLTIWNSDPANKKFHSPHGDPIPYYRKSTDYPGYYEYNFSPLGRPHYIYERIYLNGQYIMNPVEEIK
ncbi:MAG: hypothetical protein RIA63_10415, partial [Cyclobacteriaceae bacterium]